MNAPARIAQLVPEVDPGHLDSLEEEAIFVLREVAAAFERPALLFSGGKDSCVVLRLAEKAFKSQHGGDEFIYILSGKMEFTIAGESTVLNPGDSVYFNPREKHSARALGKKPVRYLDIFMQDGGEETGADSAKV